MRDILGDRDSAIPDVTTRVSEPTREEQLPNRFYKAADAVKAEGGWRVELDGRPVRTPGRSLLQLPEEKQVRLVAAEWDAQGERIDPITMPATRLVNTALDGVSADMQAVKEDIIRFAGTDMLCYRADGPQGLIDRQNEMWDPLIGWAHSSLGCRLVLAEGVMHVEQPPESIAAFSTHVGVIDDPIRLASLHVATAISGSAVLAMALFKGEKSLSEAWSIAHLDEDWNIEQWGQDHEATMRRAARFKDMEAAVQLMGGRL